ncbi:helix-turn-helix domain-containing protein [Streptomyces sp. NPDC005808]|uniref:helix-turn-helix domain-containing protein n=1 Tax=Streptomyces sp. NPDC005808 TaxID=3364734 RepID=UPI0036B36BBB
MSIRIIDCTDALELYRHYDGQTEGQPAYIELDLREGTLLADYNGEIGNAVPGTVHHGIERRYSIPTLTGDAANRVMKELAPLAERILADWEEKWNGNNNVAVLGEDALAAEEEIEDRLGCNLGYGDLDADTQGFEDIDIVQEWNVDGATNGDEADEYGITADTTDGRLDEIAAEITRDMAACAGRTEGDPRVPVAVVHGLNEYLCDLRNELAEEDPLTTAELRTAREQLGLTGDHLAKRLGVNPRTLRSWEQGRDQVPGRIRPEIAELKADTSKAVADMVAGIEGEDDPVLFTFRSDEEYLAAHRGGRWSAAWHRQVCARAAEQAGARIEYTNDVEDDEA